MRKPLLILILFISFLIARGEEAIPPLKAIEDFGRISISDGSSFFTFAKDGSFNSGPLGLSGRTMQSHWIKDRDEHLIVTAKMGWINGFSQNDQWRRIVFYISHVFKPHPEAMFPIGECLQLSDSYFLIEEMTAIPKPSEVK